MRPVRLASVFVLILPVAALLLWTVSRQHASAAPDIPLEDAIARADNGLLQPQISADQNAANCVPYEQSQRYSKRRNQITIGPQQSWISAIQNAQPDTEILMLDGNYTLNQYAVVVGKSITIRSASQDRTAVVISGQGYAAPGEGFMIIGADVTIADISVTAIRDHAISIKPQEGARENTVLYNLALTDIGTQHIKLNTGGSRNGVIACSSIGYTQNGARGDYNGAIDLHEAIDWTIRDNLIYNIRGDGSGCNVNRDCGSYISGPAILVWNGAKGTRITRNRIFNSFRNIALGLGRGHSDGTISHNLIVQNSAGDAGIELQSASNTTIENNTVILSGRYPGAIEFRESRQIFIRNNQLTSEPYNRGDNSQIEETNNISDPELFKRLTAGTPNDGQ